MQAWIVQEYRGCSIHVLSVLGHRSRVGYAYTGFVCAPKTGVMVYPQLERFHHTAADFDSADAAISAGILEGQAIIERWLASHAEESGSRSATANNTSRTMRAD